MNGQTAAQKSDFILHKQTREESRDLSVFDSFLVKVGAKVMTTSKTSSPLEWNKSVLGLVATIVALVVILVGVVWNYAVLSTSFNTLNEKVGKLEQRLDKREEVDRVKELKEAELRGYKLRDTESDNHGEQPNKK